MSFIVSCDQLGETFRAAPFCALNLKSAFTHVASIYANLLGQKKEFT